MDELNDFLNCSPNFKRIPVSGGYVNGSIVSDPDSFQDRVVKHMGTDYAMSYQQAENKKMLQDYNNVRHNQSSSSMDYLEDDAIVLEEETVPEKDLIYDKYNFRNVCPQNLPIMAKKNQILATIHDYSALILQGPTGCGKTTQVPQFILDHAKNKGEYCNIIVTQPRKIAAISVAKRVCEERGWNLGSIVGYQVGLNVVISADTRLSYCTTGVLLQKIIHNKSLCGYTHIILDEVHERDAEMDFLLIAIRRYMILDSPKVKIILMSASIESEKFAEYFTYPKFNKLIPAPIITLETKSLFSVKEFYLCSLGKLVNDCLPQIDYEEPGISDGMFDMAKKLVQICDRIDDEEAPGQPRPTILIFLPGISEIEIMHKKLSNNQMKKLQIIPLHSSITTEEQNRIFRPPNRECRIVILSTNIAESSVTVPDVKYVIDFCLVKLLMTDSKTGFTTLKLDWAAKNNCIQRSGRTGRVMDGRVYRLVTKHFYKTYMKDHAIPEMLRCPLENIVLKAKILDVGQPQAILALAMNPPDLSDVSNTILILKEIGALLKTVNGQYQRFDGDLTYIGKIMSILPLNVRVSRLIVFGYIFSVLEETIIIAAGLSVRKVFATPYNEPVRAYTKKLHWADGSASDLQALLNVYKIFMEKSKQNLLNDEKSASYWSTTFLVNLKALKEMNNLVDDIQTRLRNIGIKEVQGMNRVNWSAKEKQIIIKIIICGAFYPNYFVRSSTEEHNAFRELGGRDPCNTVYFSGFNEKFIRGLYERPIKEILAECTDSANNMQISFEKNNEKVYVTFINTKLPIEVSSNPLEQSMPGRIVREVYKAIKFQKKKTKHEIKVLDRVKASLYAQRKGLGCINDGIFKPHKKCDKQLNPNILPTSLVFSLFGEIPHFDHCEKFWFRPEIHKIELQQIESMIHNKNLDDFKFANPSDIFLGQIVLAATDSKYYRAKILEYKGRNNNDVIFLVQFIDYGNLADVYFASLRKIFNNLDEAPPYVFECKLAEVQPSILKSQRGVWTTEALKLFENFIIANPLEIEIYSIVHGRASVFLKVGNQQLNSLLIAKGYGQYSEENYMSKRNHDQRIRNQKMQLYNSNVAMEIDFDENYIQEYVPEIDPPSLEDCTQTVIIRGPFSPLETTLSSYMNNSNFKTIKIEHSSVNCVLLNTDPQDPHEKLLVAAAVTENKSGGEIIARSTTMMPNIKGFAALMTLIFAPTIELKRNSDKTQYIGILSGLGCDPETNMSLFPEHDLLLALDLEIGANDIKKINQIRNAMDSLLLTLPGEETPTNPSILFVQVTQKIKELIIELLETPRHSMGKQHPINGFIWGQYEEEEVVIMPVINTVRAIFPVHNILKLFPESSHKIKMLQKNCNELHNLKDLNIFIGPTECKLCTKTVESSQELRIHLYSRLHLDREKQIKFSSKF